MNEELSTVKQLIELAVTSGRSHQSPQTGYVQWFHGRTDETFNHTIPPFENALFALSLLRTHTQQNALEAKEILEKLLPFQVESGNFPRYLHEFPHCKDRYYGIHMLTVFAAVLKEYGKILGASLREKIEEAARKLLALYSEENPPFPLAIKLAGAESSLEKKESPRLEKLYQESVEPDFGFWYAPDNIAETYVGLSLAYGAISSSPWKHFWNVLQSSWFAKARCYAGPALKVLQRRHEPEPTLYDLILGELTGGFAYYCYADHPYQLQGALILDKGDRIAPQERLEREGKVAGQPWRVRHCSSFSWSALDTAAAIPPELKKGVHPFRLLWGDENQISSLSLQGGRISQLETEEVEGGLNLLLTLGEEAEFPTREKSEEITLFVNQHEALEISVWEKKATAFSLEDVLTLQSGTFSMRLQFELIEGEGAFQGHLQPSNRPAQIALKGEERFVQFDRKISLRTVRRKGACKIRLRLRMP